MINVAADIVWRMVYFGPVLLFMALLGALDYLTTRKILNAGGIELNPFVKWFIKKRIFGLFKTLSTLLIVYIIWHYCSRYTVLMAIASGLICALYVAVVFNNVRLICILKRNSK